MMILWHVNAWHFTKTCNVKQKVVHLILHPPKHLMNQETCKNYTTYCAHQTRGFSWSINCISNHFGVFHFSKLKWLQFTSLINTTCPKEQSLSSIVISSISSLTWFKWLYSYNKRGHMILTLYSTTISTIIELPTKSWIHFIFL
jgi:hypothetical protein